MTDMKQIVTDLDIGGYCGQLNEDEVTQIATQAITKLSENMPIEVIKAKAVYDFVRDNQVRTLDDMVFFETMDVIDIHTEEYAAEALAGFVTDKVVTNGDFQAVHSAVSMHVLEN